jgi:hypothetical protein
MGRLHRTIIHLILGVVYLAGLAGSALLTVNSDFHDRHLRPDLTSIGHAGFESMGGRLRLRGERGQLILPARSWPGVIRLWRGERRGRVTVRLDGRPVGTWSPGADRLRLILPAGVNRLTLERTGPGPPLTLTRIIVSNVIGYSSGWPAVYLTPGPAPASGPSGRGWWWLILIAAAVFGLHLYAERHRPLGAAGLAIAGWTLIPPAVLVLLAAGLRLAGYGLVWPLSSLLTATAGPTTVGVLVAMRRSQIAAWLAGPEPEGWPGWGPRWWRRYGRLIVVLWALAGAVVAADSVRDLVVRKAGQDLTARYPGLAVLALKPRLDRLLAPHEAVGFVAAPGRSIFRPQVSLAQVRFALSPRVVTSPEFEEPYWGGGPRRIIVIRPGRENVADWLARSVKWPGTILDAIDRLGFALEPRWVIATGPDRKAVLGLLKRHGLRPVLIRPGWALAERR